MLLPRQPEILTQLVRVVTKDTSTAVRCAALDALAALDDCTTAEVVDIVKWVIEYCRDPESTGCSLDDITALMAEAEKLKAVSTPEKAVRWSPEIDAAVAKCD